MERMTRYNEFGEVETNQTGQGKDKKHYGCKDLHKRLAEYEDTNLMPDEIKELSSTIENLIEQEFRAIIEKHGHFKNHHEMVSVLQEEVEEMLENAKQALNWREWVWTNIRSNQNQNIEFNLKRIENAARETINEAIQVIAVIKKAQQGYTK